MKPPVYSRTAAALHWVHAGLVCALFVIGFSMVDLPKGSERSAAYGLHKSLGLLALLLIGLRTAWRLRCPPPPHPGLQGPSAALAKAVHYLLYLLLALVPLSGFAAVCFTPYPLVFFGIPLAKPGWPDAELNALFGLAHKGLTFSLAALALLHVAAALGHAWRRDGTLGRMLPWGGSRRKAAAGPGGELRLL